MKGYMNVERHYGDRVFRKAFRHNRAVTGGWKRLHKEGVRMLLV